MDIGRCELNCVQLQKSAKRARLQTFIDEHPPSVSVLVVQVPPSFIWREEGMGKRRKLRAWREDEEPKCGRRLCTASGAYLLISPLRLACDTPTH